MTETVTEDNCEAATPKATPDPPLESAPEGSPDAASSETSNPEAVPEEEEEEKEEEFVQAAIPIFKNVTALDFVGPHEVLHLLPHVKVVFVSLAKDSYKADLGMLSFHATATFDEVRLMMEYDPHLPFHSGSVGHADPDTISRAKDWLENLNGWTICPDSAWFFQSPPEVEPEDIPNVPAEEAAPDPADKVTVEAPSEPKQIYTALFIDQEPVERPPHLPQPKNNSDVSTVPPVQPTPPTLSR